MNSLDVSSLPLTVEKLNGKNYRNWAQSFKLVINGKGKMEYLTEKTKTRFNQRRCNTTVEFRKLNGDCIARQLHATSNGRNLSIFTDIK